MDLKRYFEKNKGMGVMATADAQGKVNAAVYSRPHVMDDGTLAFIMRDRLTHQNVSSNPNATFLFRENSDGYKGIRLYLTKIREEENSPLIEQLSRRQYPPGGSAPETRFLVFFTVKNQLPLIGAGD